LTHPLIHTLIQHSFLTERGSFHLLIFRILRVSDTDTFLFSLDQSLAQLKELNRGFSLEPDTEHLVHSLENFISKAKKLHPYDGSINDLFMETFENEGFGKAQPKFRYSTLY
jgi:hypothetical protein